MSRAITLCHGDFGRLCFIEVDRGTVVHAHREGQLLFLIGGEDVKFVVNNQPKTLTLANGLAINSLTPHEMKVEPGSSTSTLLSMHINPLWFATKVRASNPEWTDFGVVDVQMSADALQHLQHLATLLKPPVPDKHADYFVAVATRLQHLLSECFGQDDVLVSHNEISESPLQTCDHRIKKSLTIMNTNVRNDIPLDEIASQAGLSRPHFYRLFRDNLGVTPNLYLNMLRMEFAAERMIFSDQPVTAIGLELGFASQASFTRFFGANLGVPPTDYRRVACVAPNTVSKLPAYQDTDNQPGDRSASA